MRLIPLEHPIPSGIEHQRFRLRLITVNDLVRDYDAVMSSAPRLRERFPHGSWPEDSMTMEQDLVDLGWHQKEAQLRRSFAYAIVDPEGPRMLGCAYIDPPAKAGADAEVTLWVRADEESTGLEDEIEAAMREWLAAEWPFEAVRWPGRELSWDEWAALPDA